MVMKHILEKENLIQKDADNGTRILQWNVILLWLSKLKLGRFIHIERSGHRIEKLQLSNQLKEAQKITQPTHSIGVVELFVNLY